MGRHVPAAKRGHDTPTRGGSLSVFGCPLGEFSSGYTVDALVFPKASAARDDAREVARIDTTEAKDSFHAWVLSCCTAARRLQVHS